MNKHSTSGWLERLLLRLPKRTILLPVVVAVVMIASVVTMWQLVRTEQALRLNADTRSNLEHFAARLESHIETRLAVGEHMRQEFEDGRIRSTKDFQMEADSAREAFGDFQAINWVSADGIIAWVTPLKGNEAALGLNIREVAAAKDTFLKAEHTGLSQFTPPIDLAQGGKGFVGYIPLAAEGVILAYINMVFRIEPLVTSALADDLLDSYCLTISDSGKVVYESIHNVVNADEEVSRNIKVGVRNWAVAISPTTHTLLAKETIVDELILIVGITFSLIVAFLAHMAMAHQQKLRANDKMFRTFIEYSPSAIMIKDLSGRYLHTNSLWQQWFNPKGFELKNKRVDDMFPADFADIVKREDSRVIKEKGAIEEELITTAGDGGKITALMQKFPIMDDSGRIVAIGGIHTDISARKKTEETLRLALAKAEEANHSKSKFLATMSHELRTPLNAIIGFSDIMYGQYFGAIGSEKYIEYAKDINISGKHLLALIDEVLDISAIELGGRELVMEPLALTGILTECVKSSEPRARKRRLHLSLETFADLPPILADETAVKQIFLNLLTNAIKFSIPGDRITLSTTMTEQDVIIAVADTGQGIGEEYLSTITEPFVKGEHSSLVANEGVGLGLSIVKSLVDAHNGDIRIESELGTGTTVFVSFPKLERQLAA